MTYGNVQIGNNYSPEQLQRLAAPAVALADSALLRETYKRELNVLRERADARASTLAGVRASYQNTKRRFRALLGEYELAKKGL